MQSLGILAVAAGTIVAIVAVVRLRTLSPAPAVILGGIALVAMVSIAVNHG